ncbi:MAG: glutamate racemase [Desulfobacterales bacterium]|jgi:glutamate racemase|nr:glutamate racemase [Desulfobacterales bacterium]MDD3082204.1 glutamate racemase [Desulfobacterales bacterium]MDD3951240.1 glutamate racemase [Desulfobacterales bacterium]MDD4463690.1 glutamate racemase [Desulfobacterales bacterium]MDY0378704.1 glutamate racemase [Desulfobacterales bacterium]
MIGIFDSGIGGLTVVREFMQHLPGYDIIYFGDTARTPYGSKSPETVVEYARQNTEFLLEHGAKIIVMACNTASSVATDTLVQSYDVPVFEVVTPAVELAVQATRYGRIGVIGTRATINSGVYEKKILQIAPKARVYSRACPLFVPLVEEGWIRKPETAMIVKKYLFPLKVRRIDTLILGCTHYPLLKETIQRKIGKQVRVIDSSVAITRKVREFLDRHSELDRSLSQNRVQRFFVSDVTPQFEKTAMELLKTRIRLELIRQ